MHKFIKQNVFFFLRQLVSLLARAQQNVLNKDITYHKRKLISNVIKLMLGVYFQIKTCKTHAIKIDRDTMGIQNRIVKNVVIDGEKNRQTRQNEK